MQEVILVQVQRRLLRLWNVLTILILTVVFLQTILGRFEGEPIPAWIWLFLHILPCTVLLYLGIYFYTHSVKIITLFAFRAVYWFTFTYLLLVLGTIIAEPFAIQYNNYTLPEYLQLSYTWLIPFNCLLIAAYGILFFYKKALPTIRNTQEETKEAPETLTKLNVPATLKNQCRKHIENNQLSAIFKVLSAHYQNQLPDQVLALQRRHKEVQEEKINDTIEPAAARRELNKITITLLKML